MEGFASRNIPVKGIAGALSVLILYFFLYQPLMKEIKQRAGEWQRMEREVQEARAMVAALKNRGHKWTFISEEAVPPALEELTAQGKAKGLSFVSMTPRTIEKPQGEGYRMLPIDMEIESSYEALGIFLGSLEELGRSLVTVSSFEIIPDRSGPSKLRTRLVLRIHLSA